MKRGGPLNRLKPLLRVPFKPARVDGKASRIRRVERRAADRKTTDFSKPAKAAMKERADGRCEWWQGCTERDTDNAHREKRSTLNGHASNGVRLCRGHHEHCHAHPVEARALGLILNAGTDYRAAPVRIRQWDGWVLLDDGGGFTPVEAAA